MADRNTRYAVIAIGVVLMLVHTSKLSELDAFQVIGGIKPSSKNRVGNVSLVTQKALMMEKVAVVAYYALLHASIFTIVRLGFRIKDHFDGARQGWVLASLFFALELSLWNCYEDAITLSRAEVTAWAQLGWVAFVVSIIVHVLDAFHGVWKWADEPHDHWHYVQIPLQPMQMGPGHPFYNWPVGDAAAGNRRNV